MTMLSALGARSTGSILQVYCGDKACMVTIILELIMLRYVRYISFD